jgi:hypothetical protein
MQNQTLQCKTLQASSTAHDQDLQNLMLQIQGTTESHTEKHQALQKQTLQM